MSILNIILKATDQASSVIKSVENNIKDISKSTASLNSVGGAISSTGRAMTVGLTLPLGVLGGVVAKTAISFEDSMAKVHAISGATADEFKKLTDAARDMGRNTTYTASQVADGMTFLAQGGYNATQILAAMPAMIRLAQAGVIDLGQATSISIDTMNAFGIATDQASHFADVLAMTANKTNTDIAMLGDSFKYVAPVAHVFNISLEQTSAMLGLMANNGIKATQAGTTLRMGLERLAKPTKQARKVLDDYHIALKDSKGELLPFPQIIDNLNRAFSHMTNAQKVAATQAIFGTEAMTGMLVLIQAGSKNLNSLTDSFVNSNGAAQQMADTMNNTTGGSLRKMNAALSDAAITAGDVLAPSITNVAHVIRDMALAFSKLPPGVQQTIVDIIALVAALGPILMVIGSVMKGVETLVKLFRFLGPVLEFIAGAFAAVSIEVLLVIAAIVSLAVIIVNVVKHWSEIVEFYKSAWQSFAAFFKNLWVEISNGFSTSLAFIGNKISSFKAFFVSIFQGAADLVLSPFRAVASGVNSVIDSINGLHVDIPDWVPFVGGKKLAFSIPHIPKFHTGGTFRAAVAGGEGLAMLKDGERVERGRSTNNDSNGRIGTFPVIINLGGKRVGSAMIDVFGRGMVRAIKLRTGVTS